MREWLKTCYGDRFTGIKLFSHHHLHRQQQQPQQTNDDTSKGSHRDE